MIYPLFFKPVYKDYIWGGRNFENVLNRRDLPEGKVAESWELCCHKNGMSVVSNGELAGKTIQEVIDIYGEKLLGTNNNSKDRFPLLIKILDANDKLSVQVHPSDEYALKNENDLGKTEMWYVVDAKQGAQIVYGLKQGTKKDDLLNSIKSGTLEKHLNYVDIKKGDVIYIPSGTVHALLEGALIAEIQQNSDSTYRVYDWNRLDKEGKGRPLHIEKAMEVINFEYSNQIIHTSDKTSVLIDCPHFNVSKVVVSDNYQDETDNTTFHIYTALDGEGIVIYNNIEYPINKGTTFMIPASPGSYKINGKLELLKTIK